MDFQNKIPKTLDDFVNASDLYEMEEIVGNYFGAYIADELKEPQPINVFLKSPRIDDAKETKLYLGAAFRYYW
ncbi:hypothetical protein FACS1894188_07150 [Clostridia bacterium]|nr:hypothetical protein FACS1894188_07150 [Clostridia bacterium]